MAFSINERSLGTSVWPVRVAQGIKLQNTSSSVLNTLRTDKTCFNEQAHLTFTPYSPQDEVGLKAATSWFLSRGILEQFLLAREMAAEASSDKDESSEVVNEGQ